MAVEKKRESQLGIGQDIETDLNASHITAEEFEQLNESAEGDENALQTKLLLRNLQGWLSVKEMREIARLQTANSWTLEIMPGAVGAIEVNVLLFFFLALVRFLCTCLCCVLGFPHLLTP
jgi:hypothetical protein